MAVSVQGLAAALQTHLTDDAEEAAKDAGFVVRKRKITGAGFVQGLVLGWLDDPDAKLDDLAAPMGVTVQALHGLRLIAAGARNASTTAEVCARRP